MSPLGHNHIAGTQQTNPAAHTIHQGATGGLGIPVVSQIMPIPLIPPIQVTQLANGQTTRSPADIEQERLQAIERVNRLHEQVNQMQDLRRLSQGATQIAPPQPHLLSPAFQNLIAQQQRDRAAMGMHGAQYWVNGPNPHAGQIGYQPGAANRILNRPHQTRTSTHNLTGPHGERWQVTVNETTTVFPANSAAHQAPMAPEPSSINHMHELVQNIVRAVDGIAAPQPGRPSSSQGLNNSPNPQVAATIVREISRPASAPPSNASITVPGHIASAQSSSEQVAPATNAMVASASANPPSLAGPMVYILSSPTGPRGLLIGPSENGIEAFYTPRPTSNTTSLYQNQLQGDPSLVHREARQRRADRPHRNARGQAEAAAGAAPAVAHPANPPAGAVAAQIWPHLWLVVRLLGFIWFFTSGSNSWWRIIMISGLAFIVFLASTGVFNGIADPVRRHLEGLLPLAGPNGAHAAIPGNDPAAPQNAGAPAPAVGQAAEPAGQNQGAAQPPPDPAQTAARLLEQRRVANANWLWTQIRRAEHAAILFLASLVPGVGERHIAARAAEENVIMEAQRQQIAAAAAAVEAARAEGNAAEGGQGDSSEAAATGDVAVENGSSLQHSEGVASGTHQNADAGDRAEEAPVPPLIDV
jgi:hypothetical protein